MMPRWKTLTRHILLDIPPWFRVVQEEVLLPDGQTTVSDFYLVEGPPFASVVALTPDDKVLMLYGYLHGVRQETYALPGGMVEEGEKPLQSIKRELREETGYTSTQWHPLGGYTLDGNRNYYTGHLFLARGATRVRTPSAQDLETRSVVRLPIAEVRHRWQRGDFATVPMVMAIGLALHHLKGTH